MNPDPTLETGYRRKMVHVCRQHPDGTEDRHIVFLRPGESLAEALKRNGVDQTELDQFQEVRNHE